MSEDTEVGGMKRFAFPQLPSSINAIYNILFSQRRVEMKPEVRLYKTKMKEYVPRMEVKEGECVGLSITIWMNTLFKNGKLRKVDVHNMSKVLVDLISEKQGWDDSQLFELNISKKHSTDKEMVEVEEYFA